MAGEDKEKTQVEKSTEAKAPGKKSDLMTYVIVGVGSLLVTIGVLLALIDTDQGLTEQSDAYEDESVPSSSHKSDGKSGKNKDKESQLPDIFAELEDLSFLDVSNLLGEAEENAAKLGASLDDKNQTSKKDSIEALDWITTEKKKISQERVELDKLKKRLDAQERTIDQKLRQVDQAAAAKLNSLAKLYDGMKPDQVARMIVKLEDKLIVSILPRMKKANASKILGLMPPSRGARISKQMITLAVK